MKRFFLFTLLSLFCTLAVWSQRYVVTGQVKEAKTQLPVEFASAALLRADSTAILAGTTDEQGRFKLTAKAPGKYIVRLSYIGYGTLTRNVELTAQRDSVHMGLIELGSTDNTLGTATVSVAASRVEQKEDTTMFNAAAYRVPEGSTLEALIKQLPGVEVSDDGTIKWNGKTVKEFLVNGKDFFKGDTETAMKNLPTELVSKIKAYDKQSEYTEQTGIDDGEETTVLDISTKKAMKESWITNVDVAYGSHNRYTGRVFATRFTDRTRVSVFGSMNNTNNRGFGGPHGFGGNQGLVTTKHAGMDFSWENGKTKREAGRFEVGGYVRYRHSDTDLLSTSNSETFLTSGSTSSFANAWNNSGSRSSSVNTGFRLQWNPDSMTNITFRPSYSYSDGKNTGHSLSATFNDDPYDIEGMRNPLDSIFAEDVMLTNPELYALMVNTNNRLSLGNNKSHNVNASLNVVRRLNSRGRNLSLRLRGGYTKSERESFSISHIDYNKASTKRPSFLNQYSTTPSTNYNYAARIGYAEPITKNWFAEARYEFSYKYSDSDRSRFNLDSLAYDPYKTLFPGNELFGDPDLYLPIGTLPTLNEALQAVRDMNNSQYATYKYYDHTANIGVRYNSEKIRFNIGADFNPERTKMAYNRPGQHIDTLITREVFNVAPSLRFRYKFSKTDQLDIRYRGYSSQPSMTDLLAVVDDANPLNISMGNPGLKPSWNNNLYIRYNGYDPARQQGMMGGINFSQTRNAVSNRMVYDETTGVRYMRPENINGNWNGRGMFMINSAIGNKKLFNISSFTSLNFDNSVGYVSRMKSQRAATSEGSLMALPMAQTTTNDRSYDYYNGIFNSAISEKNTTRTLGFDEHLRASYRASWFDLGFIGRVKYQHARATVQENANMDTWNFSYGANANFNFDFGLSISTDIRMSSRRGYSDASMNTNELLWNAQIAQSFLRNRAATVSIQFYDILQQQSNVSRVLSATQRVDSWSNAINSYFMVHFIYKLNIFGGKSKDGNKSKRWGGRGGMHSMPMMRMGHPM